MTLNLPLISTTRTCGDCTACCTALGINSIEKKPGETCRHLNGCCTIYANRPKECRDYKCWWLVGFLPDQYQPNKVGYIFGAEVELATGKKLLTAIESYPGAFDKPETIYSLRKLVQTVKQPILMSSSWRLKATIVMPKNKSVQAAVKKLFNDSNYEYIY